VPDEATPLIPLLRPGEAVTDPVVLETWYDALANALGVEVAHDLLALWFFPASGGVQLVGPVELAEDHLDVPRPSPRLGPADLEPLAATVRRAYPTVVTLPVTLGSSDVGLMLVASLAPNAYDERQRGVLARTADGIAPTLSRIALQWGPAEPPADQRPHQAADDLVSAVTTGWTEARSPKDFLALLSGALHRMLPHDRLELLIPGPQPGQQYRLGSHSGPAPWNDPALVVKREALDLTALAGADARLRIPDAAALVSWPQGFMGEELPGGGSIRSVIGVRVMSGGRLVAHLLAGSTSPDLYQPDDLRLLEQAARLIAPKIEAYVLTSQLAALRAHLTALRAAPAHLAVLADLLATTPQLADATRRAAEEARALLPCDTVTFALRLADGDRVVMLEPGENKHLVDLPLLPVGGSVLGQVLRGEVADALEESAQSTVLMVPLRAAGRILGALVLSAKGRGGLGRGDVGPAQQLADLVAPYLELARRAAMLPAPFIPGWKRVGG
jgi:hypothetical protein